MACPNSQLCTQQSGKAVGDWDLRDLTMAAALLAADLVSTQRRIVQAPVCQIVIFAFSVPAMSTLSDDLQAVPCKGSSQSGTSTALYAK